MISSCSSFAGPLLALFGVDDLGRDAHAVPERGRGGIRSSIIITVDRSQDVDELTERARVAGARITKDPVAAEFFEGRDAYFADPEGNYWEVAWSARRQPGYRRRPPRRRSVIVPRAVPHRIRNRLSGRGPASSAMLTTVLICGVGSTKQRSISTSTAAAFRWLPYTASALITARSRRRWKPSFPARDTGGSIQICRAWATRRPTA